MGQVAITIHGRTYTVQCTDGEEARLVELANYVRDRADALAEAFRSDGGPISDDRLLVLTALLLADELWEAREGATAPAPAPGLNGAGAHPVMPPYGPRAHGGVAR
jgi:cell division protein ZapA